MGKPNKDYLNYIKSMPCAIHRKNKHICFGDVVPHHAGRTGKGVGTKCDDIETIPLCMRAHTSIHNKGVKWFQNYYNTDINGLIAYYQSSYKENKIKGLW